MQDGLSALLAGLGGRAAAVAAAVVIAAVALGGFLDVCSEQRRLEQERLPTTVQLRLKDGQKEVAQDQALEFSASRPVPTQVLHAALHFSPAASGDLAPSPDRRRFLWSPRQPLQELTEYTVTLDPVRPAGDHPVRGRSWHFTTAITPRVTSLNLASGAALGDQAEIPVGAPLQLNFNDVMDPTSTRLLANGSALALAWSADRRSAAVEASALKAGRVQFALASGARDAAGRRAVDWTLEGTLVFHAATRTVALRAPALVQVANDPAGRDQTGLQSADVVYEYLTEGGVTRLTAVFSRAPEAVGPVQGGRLISLKLTRHHRGMLFMSDLSRGSTARLNTAPVPTSLDAAGAFYRASTRPPPDNLYASGTSIQQAEERKGLAQVAVQAGAISIAGGEPANDVSIPDHRSTYSFDAESGTYVKTEDGHRFVDAGLGQPIHIRLLVVLHTSATATSYPEDARGRRGLDFDLDSGGRADFYYGGLHAAGRWVAPDRDGTLRFLLESGAPVSPPTGLTWIDVTTA